MRLDPQPKPKPQQITFDEVDQYIGILDRDLHVRVRR
jgi:hypothetical protein